MRRANGLLPLLASLLLCLPGQLNSEQPADFSAASSRNRRDILDNIRKDDPKSNCRNGGIFAGGECHCIHPHTGPRCQDYACVHGMSVGFRFDPKSLFFNKPCICNEGWSGDLCEYHLTERCSGRGEWKDGHCACIGYFFGSECQYTSRCDNGRIQHGRCICHKNWEGEYCHEIVCLYGYADLKNDSASCVCPQQYKGIHCDQCSQEGPKIEPFPLCVIKMAVRNPNLVRKDAKRQVKSRLTIILIAAGILLLFAIMVTALYQYRRCQQNPEIERARALELQERTRMLTDAAMKSGEPPPVTRKWSITGRAHESTKPEGVKTRRFSMPFRAGQVPSSSFG